MCIRDSGIDNAVVVGVDKRIALAALQGITGAFGQELLERGRRSLEIRRAVAAHLVHHQHHAFGAALCRQGVVSNVKAPPHIYTSLFAGSVVVEDATWSSTRGR